jgi:asparagine synthase (glutamine-hydrolysing)
MKFFVCVVDLQGHGLPPAVREDYESVARSRDLAFCWQSLGQVSVLLCNNGVDDEPMVAHDGSHVAVGTVRLDNRADLARWSASAGRELNDLELVLRTVAQHGTRYISQFLGDFAFVVWNAATRTVVAACDVFSVKKLYYCPRHELLVFASRGEVLAVDGRYELQYLAERVAACAPTPGLTPYAGVRSVPAGCVLVAGRARLTTSRYWSADAFTIEAGLANSEREAAETCYHLLAESIQLRLGTGMDTWAQLSGGMDSSSIVSVAQRLDAEGTIANGLAGTITFVDHHGTGADEREYSEAVVRRWRLPNKTIVDFPIWGDEQYPPPFTDEPSIGFVYYPRDYRLCTIMREAGGRVLLTGAAGDTLFTGNMFFFADWVVRGRILRAVREMARRAAIGRASFWELAYRNVVLPLLPRALQHRLVQDEGRMAPWVQPAMARRFGLDVRAFAPSSYAGRIGDKYHDAIAADIMAIPANLTVGVTEDHLDVRHPFLYRPLVEFALRLPPELCVQPYERKWILRRAMQGTVPEVVLRRVGKGTFHGLLAWSLAAHRTRIEPLVHDPILADLGIIDGGRLRSSFGLAQHAPDSRNRLHNALQTTLAVEAWLQLRSGRWPREGSIENAVSVNQSYAPSI